MTLRSSLNRLLFLPARHVSWQIMAPFALLTLFFAVLGTFLVTRLVTGSLEERFTNQLAEAARVTSDSMVRRERQHLATIRAVSFTDGMAGAVESEDGQTVAALAQPVAANNRADLIEVLGDRGQQLYAARLADSRTLSYVPGDEAAEGRNWRIVENALAGLTDASGDKFAQIAWTSQGPALFSAGPLRDGDRIVGVVVIGSLLNSFLPAAKSESLADVTLYDLDGRPLASTFADDPGDADLRPGSRGPAATATSNRRERKTLFGRDYDLLYGQLRLRNETVGLYSVALPTDYISNAGESARLQMSLLFAGVTLTVLLTGWLLARKFTGPLAQLVTTARAVSAGDLTARSNVRTRDEVGILADAFDTMTARLERQHLSTIAALASAIDARDPYTAGHSVRVGQLSAELGTALGFAPSKVQHLKVGGYLHDIGKIGIRDAILLKPEGLSAEDRKLMEQHPRIGLDILAPVDLAPEVIALVAGHHERMNGAGYPDKLAGDEISIFPRIGAVADVYDALTSDRPYRAAMAPDEALRILQRESMEGLLDPEIVATLRRIAVAWEERRRSDPLLRAFKISARLIEPAA